MTSQLARLEELARAATPKWQAYERNRGLITHEWEIRTPTNGTLFRSTSYGNMNADAEFVGAASPDVILSLINKLRVAREALEFYAKINHMNIIGEFDEGLVRTTRHAGVVETGWRARKALEELERE